MENKYPQVRITLEKPVNGYWDGGAKQVFTFEADECQDKKGKFLKWGCWAMNFWRSTDGIGTSPRQAAGTFARWAKKNLRYQNAKIEIID